MQDRKPVCYPLPPLEFSPGEIGLPTRPPKSAIRPWNVFMSFGFCYLKCNQSKELTAITTRTILFMHVSKGVRGFLFGAAVLLGFSALAPKAWAQG